MRTIKVEVDVQPRSVRFALPGTKIFKNGGFDLQYSFDIAPSERGLSSMAIGLLAPIIARNIRGNVEIALPTPLDQADLLAWRDYHQLPERIHVSGLPSAVTSPTRPIEHESPLALLYGGGKDSVAALTIARELYPSSPLHLLRLHWNAKSPTRHKEAFEGYVLPELRKHTSFAYISVQSSMHAELVERTDAASIHLARYLCSFLPYVEMQNPRFLCHGYDALEYHGTAYRRAHPQVLRYIDSVYHRLGAATVIRSLCFATPPKVSFSLISSLRPELVPAIYMCESLEQRWCYNCRKCFTYGLLCLAHRLTPRSFDFQRMFSPTTPYMSRISQQLARLDGQSDIEGLSGLLAYPAHFQAVSGWGPEVVKGAATLNLPDSAIAVIQTLFVLIDGFARPEMNSFWSKAALYEGGPAFSKALEALATNASISSCTDSPISGHVKGAPVSYLMGDIE